MQSYRRRAGPVMAPALLFHATGRTSARNPVAACRELFRGGFLGDAKVTSPEAFLTPRLALRWLPCRRRIISSNRFHPGPSSRLRERRAMVSAVILGLGLMRKSSSPWCSRSACLAEVFRDLLSACPSSISTRGWLNFSGRRGRPRILSFNGAEDLKRIVECGHVHREGRHHFETSSCCKSGFLAIGLLL